MSDFEKVRQSILFILLIVITLPLMFVGMEMAVIVLGISSVVIVPIVFVWVNDYLKFKKSKFKTYEKYWHYHHNMK